MTPKQSVDFLKNVALDFRQRGDIYVADQTAAAANLIEALEPINENHANIMSLFDHCQPKWPEGFIGLARAKILEGRAARINLDRIKSKNIIKP